MADDNDDDDDSSESPPPPEKPPVLDYPSIPPNPELDSEKWSDVFRASLIVFGILGFLLFISYGLCGGLIRGCM